MFALFFFLFSCSTPCRQWTHDTINAQYPSYCCSRIVLEPDNPVRGLQLEITRTPSGVRVYINTLSLSFPKATHDSSKSEVTMEYDNKTVVFLANRLDGGQKLLISPHDADTVIQKLLEGKTISLSIGRFHSKITPLGFKKTYRNL